MCGENAGVLHYGKDRKGSPPRVRGKHQIRNGIKAFKRITPAHAGKTEEVLAKKKSKKKEAF